MTEEEYDAFWTELCAAQEAEVHGFEDKHVFEGCMPVEVMARRGKQTLCYGPLKPRGLNDPKTGREPFAVVQLRRDNADGTIYNLVGFQTHLKWPEQRRVFSMIPALRNAEFVRYGVMHRNTYLDSPRLLDRYYRVKKEPRVCFAGQITGVEGYVESTASGFLAAVELARRLEGKPPVDFPQETAVGALARYISNESVTDFQPMNVNFGITPPVGSGVMGLRNKTAALSNGAWVLLVGLDGGLGGPHRPPLQEHRAAPTRRGDPCGRPPCRAHVRRGGCPHPPTAAGFPHRHPGDRTERAAIKAAPTGTLGGPNAWGRPLWSPALPRTPVGADAHIRPLLKAAVP